MSNNFVREIGPYLYAACTQDNVPAMRRLTAVAPPWDWSSVLRIAAASGALEVSKYCIQQVAEVSDKVLRRVICNAASEPVYRYFVEEGLVDVEYRIEWWGTMLGGSAL